MKIVIVGQGITGVGGVPTVARWLVDQLARDPDFTVEVVDLATSSVDSNSRRILAPSTWFRRSLRGSDDGSGVTRWGANMPELEVARYLPRKELTAHLRTADVIQVVAGGPAVGRACIAAGPPIVLQVATLSSWERVALDGLLRRVLAAFNQPLVAAFERRALRESAAILVENRQMAGFVRELGQENVRIAPPGVDCAVFSTDGDSWKSDGALLSVSRLSDGRKGLERLLRAYEILVMQMGDATPRLILAGAGPVPAVLTDALERPAIRDRVTILPDIDQADLPALYRQASCFVQASYEEGLGLSSVEAMACGLPVVASATAGSCEVVEEGVTGRLVQEGTAFEEDFAAALQSVLCVDGQRMASMARERAVEVFSNESTFKAFRDVYLNVMHLST